MLLLEHTLNVVEIRDLFDAERRRAERVAVSVLVTQVRYAGLHDK